MQVDANRVPVIIGVGQINDRGADGTGAMDSRGLMMSALSAAEMDTGAQVLDRVEWMGVVNQISFPDPEIHLRLAEMLPRRPRHQYRSGNHRQL